MKSARLADGVYWVGAIDWDIRDFHSLMTPRGTTYNSYLIVDDKVCLIDAIHAGHGESLLRHIADYVDPARIDYVISNHSEYDHTGFLPQLMNAAPHAKLLASKEGVKRLTAMYRREWNMQEVADGEELPLGRRTLKFIYAPLLHWPETMFTWSPQDRVLFSCDAFAAHLASTERFVDELSPELVMLYNRQYYAFLLHAFRKAVRQAMGKIEAFDMQVIAPSHGPIWRGGDIQRLLADYGRWAAGELENKATIVYASMWGRTRSMVPSIVEGLGEAGLEARVYDLKRSQFSDIIADTFDSKLIVIGSPTFESGAYPPVEAFIPWMRVPRDRSKKIALFGSYGWSGGAIQKLQKALGEGGEGYELMEETLKVQFAPTQQQLADAFDFGRRAAEWAGRQAAGEQGREQAAN